MVDRRVLRWAADAVVLREYIPQSGRVVSDFMVETAGRTHLLTCVARPSIALLSLHTGVLLDLASCLDEDGRSEGVTASRQKETSVIRRART